MAKTILRLPAVKTQTGYSRSTLYWRVSEGLFTKQIKLGARSIGWPADDVAILNNARISGKSDSEIRELVIKLEIARKSAMQEV